MNYQSPEIQRIELDLLISLQMTSLDAPPYEPDNWVQVPGETNPATTKNYHV